MSKVGRAGAELIDIEGADVGSEILEEEEAESKEGS